MTPDETLRVLGTLMEAVGKKTDCTINKEFDATACVTYTAKVFSTLDSLDKDAANVVRAKLAEEPECPMCGRKLSFYAATGKKLFCAEHGRVPDEVLNGQNEPIYDMLTVTTVNCWGTEVRIESEHGYRWSAYYDTEVPHSSFRISHLPRLKLQWEGCFVPGRGEVQPPPGTTLGMIEKLLLGAGDWSGEDPREYEPDPIGSLSQYE